MAWDHLSITKPHLVYIILGGFTSLFMLCSSIIKERLYIGEATVATICGIIFGRHAADLIDPLTWGDTDYITLEFSRIVLVVQCFAVGVELPKFYMERHWRSVVFLLVPVMTFGWLVTSLFIWAVFHSYASWLDCLCIAACVTATDPVLASSVVGKGKFAKRVPKHLRDILSAESGCNDGMAFPFIYLALYILKYGSNPSEVAFHWFCYTILYECIFGAIYGVTVGYIARRLIRIAHERDWMDRESFLVFYFVLALFCAGSGSLLGMDDLLIGFACGVGFSNDGWFSEKSEETHVSNVIDLLINLAFFVYFGTIIPWKSYDDGFLGLKVWRLVVIALLVLFFRRIPAMMALKPFIPDIKTWREALFAGHFGPIGVGAIFVAILARAELEDGPHDATVPLAVVPGPNHPHYVVIQLIWPITTFLVMTSILVHGSSIAVFTLGKHINTLALTMSYSKATDEPHWMDRLPRIQSRSKSSMSLQRSDSSMDDRNDEKQMHPGLLPLAAAGSFLRRQRDEDSPKVQSRSSSRHRSRRRNWDSGRGPGGPVSQSAYGNIANLSSLGPERFQRSDSDAVVTKSDSPPDFDEKNQETPPDLDQKQNDDEPEVFEEGDHTVYEDKEGNVLAVEDPPEAQNELAREVSEIEEGKRLMREEGAAQNEGVIPSEESPNTSSSEQVDEKAELEEREQSEVAAKDSDRQGGDWAGSKWREVSRRVGSIGWIPKREEKKKDEKKPEPKGESAPARAYQYGNTIIIEDEDGEVIKKYDIEPPERKQSTVPAHQTVAERMKHAVGLKNPRAPGTGPPPEPTTDTSPAPPAEQKRTSQEEEADDELVRFTTGGPGGRRMSKAEFVEQFREMDPKNRLRNVEDSSAPEALKREARKEARKEAGLTRTTSRPDVPVVEEQPNEEEYYSLGRIHTHESNELKRQESHTGPVPMHDVSKQLRSYQLRSGEGETAAERRRRLALQRAQAGEDSDDDGTERVPPSGPSQRPAQHGRTPSDTVETAAERRRRLGALGFNREQDSDSEDNDEPRQTPQQQRQQQQQQQQHQQQQQQPPQPTVPPAAHSATHSRPVRQRTLRWASNIGKSH